MRALSFPRLPSGSECRRARSATDTTSSTTPAPDEQLKLRKRMRAIASEEFTALFGENAPKQLGFVRNPADERVTRPIDDLSSFMFTALKRRDPKLLDVFNEWHRRFEARTVKPEDVKATATRVWRSTKRLKL